LKDCIRVILGRGERSQVVMLIDPEDVGILATHRCYPDRGKRTTYVRCYPRGKPRRAAVQIARLIMNTPDDLVPDHLNHNGLDNRRSNLRNVTQQVNTWNTQARLGTASPYKGVTFFKDGRAYPWRAAIRCPTTGKIMHLGSFTNAEAASAAYNRAARELRAEA
jgi:hypothetical protein